MPQESDPKLTADDEAARRLMEDAKAEPVPAAIVKLAEELEAALAKRRKTPLPETD